MYLNIIVGLPPCGDAYLVRHGQEISLLHCQLYVKISHFLHGIDHLIIALRLLGQHSLVYIVLPVVAGRETTSKWHMDIHFRRHRDPTPTHQTSSHTLAYLSSDMMTWLWVSTTMMSERWFRGEVV